MAVFIKENTKDLIKLAQNGDEKALDEVVSLNSGLIWSVVHKFSNRGVEKDDLFQLGSIGLIKAVRRFDDSFDVQFSTYAVPMIVGEIRRFIRDDGSIKISRSIKELSAKVHYLREDAEKNGIELSVSDIANELDVSSEDVLLALESSTPTLSLNAPVSTDEGSALEDMLSDSGAEEEKIDHMALNEVITRLEPMEQMIIRLRYFAGKTQAEIAARLQISQVQVSRLEKKLLKKLKEYLCET